MSAARLTFSRCQLPRLGNGLRARSRAPLSSDCIWTAGRSAKRARTWGEP